MQYKRYHCQPGHQGMVTLTGARIVHRELIQYYITMQYSK